MATIALPAGTIHYDEVGPADGRPVVCVHGYLMGRELWAGLAERLAARGLRVLTPTWPLGAHPEPVNDPTGPRGRAHDRRLPRRARARRRRARRQRLGRRAVPARGRRAPGAPRRRSCSPTATPSRTSRRASSRRSSQAAKVPAAFKAALAPMRTAAARRSPLGFGSAVAPRRRPPRRAVGAQRARQPPRCSRTCGSSPSTLRKELTLDAAERLPGFDQPVLFAWALDDRLFPLQRRRAPRRAAARRAHRDDRRQPDLLHDRPARPSWPRSLRISASIGVRRRR